MKGIKTIIVLSAIALLAFASATEYPISYPKNFPAPQYNFKNNPLNNASITLGRALFYDPILSKDNSISCASCHSPYNAFAHTDHQISHGINDQIGSRNAPALFNLAWQKSFMWDGAINHIEVQALAPMSHPKEMAETIEHVVEKLKNKGLYKRLFVNAYRDSMITGARLLKALAQFQLSLISGNTKYDQVKNGQNSFTVQEQNGYQLFLKNCNSCHREPLFSTYAFANNGLSVDTTLNDFGKGAISKRSADSLLFKIPSLRNLNYSPPYMHDGRFRTLNQVIKHYISLDSSQVVSENLRQKIKLNANEQIDLIAFLLALNDSSFVSKPDFSFPKFLLPQSEGNKK